MLKSVGAVDHALFDTITHLSQGECHQVSLPPFFQWYIGAAQVHAVTHVASGRLDSLRESGGGNVSSSPSFPFLLSVFVLT